jgi:hypothetical protein
MSQNKALVQGREGGRGEGGREERRTNVLTSSASREKRRMAHRDWMGSMILLLVLQARAKRVVCE